MKVLVTRPDPAAGRTADRLRAMGLEPAVLPLSRLVPLEHDVPDGAFDAVALTSASAARTMSARLLRAAVELPCHVVGESTAEAARRAGFLDVRPGGGDAKRLVAAIEAELGAGARILYPCGRVRMPALEAGLAGAGRTIVAVETYDMVSLSPPDEAVFAALEGGAADVALAYSPRGATLLAGLVRRPTLTKRFEKTVYACLSAVVAEPLSGLPTRIAATPDEDALLALLEASAADRAF